MAHLTITAECTLILRPFSLLRTPMQHPITYEQIEDPAKWIGEGSVDYDADAIVAILTTPELPYIIEPDTLREIDRRKCALHFAEDKIFENGWAIELQS